MKWLCFGAGAIGTYIGGSLALAGEPVVFLEQPSALDVIRERGLRLDLRLDRSRGATQPLAVAPDQLTVSASLGEALTHGPFDAVIFALKSFDTAAAIETMRPHSKLLPPVVCFSNGVDNESALALALGKDLVIAATVTSAIGRLGPGDIVLERLRGIGLGRQHAISGRLFASTRSADLHPRMYTDPAAMKWSKMLTNLIANPTTAILNMTAAEVLNHPGIYRLEIRMLRECLAVMRARGLDVVDLPGTPVRLLALAARLPAWMSRPLLARVAGSGRGGKMPSFHIDLHAGRGKSEVEFLHGAVVRAGRELHVPTPVNAFLTDTLTALANGKMALQEYSRQPEKLLAAYHVERTSS